MMILTAGLPATCVAAGHSYVERRSKLCGNLHVEQQQTLKIPREARFQQDRGAKWPDEDNRLQPPFLPAAEDAGLAGGKELAEYTETKRKTAHDAVNAAVKSDRLRVLLVDFFRWMEEGNWRQGTSAKSQKVEDFARAALKKRRKKLVKQAANLADLDPRSRHKIRIKAKKLRYMVEFFKTLPKIADKPKVLTRFLRCSKSFRRGLARFMMEKRR
jgi:inorganic triphosphatase YgiF